MSLELIQVDAFTDRPFCGNPAAVCLLPAPRDAAWMQQVAREMNLSETAFLVRRADGFDLRWFTPSAEVDLCGHATLAAAHVLWTEHHLAAADEARFHTRSGLLTARREGAWITMDFPAEPPREVPVPAGLAEALGVRPVWVGRNRMDLLVVLDAPAAVRTLAPDLSRLAELDVRGVIVTAPGDEGWDFVSRFFSPRLGLPEDPVTGSAHCCLGPYWSARLGRTSLAGYQASSRGGVVRVDVRGERVLLTGQAVTVVRMQLVQG